MVVEVKIGRNPKYCSVCHHSECSHMRYIDGICLECLGKHKKYKGEPETNPYTICTEFKQ